MYKLLILPVHFLNFWKMLEASFFLSSSPVATAPTVGSVSCYYLDSTVPPLGNVHFTDLFKMLNVYLGTSLFLFFLCEL